MSAPRVGIDITANDKTARGIASAEKRFSGATKRIGKATDGNLGGGGLRGIGGWSRGVIRSFTQVEQVGARLLGGGPLGSGGGSIIGRLGAMRSAASLLGTGMGEAAAGGAAMEAGLIGVGGAAAATGAVVVALAAAMAKVADSWAKGSNDLGNMASMIGVTTKGLQEFAGAAERVGVSKDTAMGTIASMSKTLNDARYGRNRDALGALTKMGIKLRTKDDGSVDTMAMLPDIAEAIKRQNAPGRQTAANALGIPLSALPAFTQGRKALGDDMAAYGKNGAIVTDEDVKLSRAIVHRDAVAAQSVEKGVLAANRANATVVKGAGDFAIGAYDSVTKHGFGTAEAAPYRGPRGQSAPPSGYTKGWRHGGRLSPAQVAKQAERARGQYRRYLNRGMTPDEAAAWAANGQMESGNNPHKQQPGGPGYGKFQWGAADPKKDRRLDFKRVMGKSIYGSTDEDQERFREWELGHKEKRADRKIDAARGAGDKAAAITQFYERPAEMRRDMADRANVAEQLIKLELSFKNPPAGISVKATSKGAISIATPNP